MSLHKCTQKESLNHLLHTLKAMHPDAIIHGHRDFAAKACPSFDATSEYKPISNKYEDEGRDEDT